MLQAVIFDMDGLLVDSEPLWTQAEIEVFGSVGINLDENSCQRTVGMGLDEVVEFRYGQKPWNGPTRQEVSRLIHSRVRDLISQKAQAKPGAMKVLEMVKEQDVKIGLATASDGELIRAVQERLDITGTFHSIRSASELEHSKPHPEVYLKVAQDLDVKPQRCVAFEDSVLGIIAAKAARMIAVAVPDRVIFDDPRFGISDMKLKSLEDFDKHKWKQLQEIASYCP